MASCAHTHTRLSAVLLYVCVFRTYIMSKQHFHICRTRTPTKHISPLYWDILRRVMEEHSVTHQDAAQCNSILPVIWKKSPPPKHSSRVSGELTVSWKITQAHTNKSLSLTFPTLYLTLRSLTFRAVFFFSGFFQSNPCLVFPLFPLSFSSSLPPIHLHSVCIW